jgi:threonine synthase
VLFGLFAELVRTGALEWAHETDVSVHGGDLSAVMSVWYAKQMGLPVANIICGCNENSSIWDLLHHGEMKTDAALISTSTPLADVSLPVELERLIYGTLGREQTQIYLQTCDRRGLYVPPSDGFEDLRQGMFAAVISRARVEVLIPSVFRTNAYLMGPYTALAYGGLMDYRAKTGESRTALILAERSPKQDLSVVALSMGLTEQQIPATKD